MSTPHYRGAIFGYGFIAAQGHTPGFLASDEFKIVAVCDIDPARRALAEKNFEGVSTYAEEAELFQKEIDLDFVVLATPPVFHLPVALRSLRRGLHVLCEKPITTNLQDAETLLGEAARAKKTVFPCHNYLYAPTIQSVRKRIAEGEIGKVRHVDIEVYRPTHAQGVAEWKSDWRRKKAYSGGGIAMDHGTHATYLTFEWLGGYPKEVDAQVECKRRDEFDTEDTFDARLGFENGSARIFLTWTADERRTIYRIEGEKGEITLDDSEIVKDSSHSEWFSSLLKRFSEAIANEEHTPREILDAYHSIEVIQQAYESAASSPKLPVASALGRG